MKKFLALLVVVTVSSSSFAGYDPKVCYKRCMDDLNDKQKCEYICYNKKAPDA
ncbi:hypothetical protein [Massilia sp. Leaf139]|uniref:hypothetical protein n=1 Tax=Massilia sp. Leaf139 TaxID=1736272 RepID=UPI000B1F1043|nr:hypothetical protein [Massilia sp. Leaf139]